ncbi:diguanylate cyclase [Geodermatophilus sp. TF02-6]|uniref:diguanylate cyclase domain-containing protein n=1 Tax=Geodermatophilus sp. TF02-6 TaxID=2250575 RepID=UPI000DEBAEAD|nr:diguanylate cyclase [Geodermatophilus sp. TF02-6]RBY77650.1 diguanylate cyclase [Geodermatophilus sp. TF02-6]
MTAEAGWDPCGQTDGERDGAPRASPPVLDTDRDGGHSALVPPGALHQRVTAALASWRLDDAEELLADVGTDPSPHVAPAPRDGAADDAPAGSPPVDPAPVDLGRAWADTLRAELLVRRLRQAGFTLLGDPVGLPHGTGSPPALDLHAGLAELIDGAQDGGARTEPASRAALAIALVRSAKAAFEATDDELQRAAGLARHARIELLSRRIDAAMDEAVEAASLLDPELPPSALLVETLTALAGVLADLELMPLALDYQRRAHQAAVAAAASGALGRRGDGHPDGGPDVLVARAATRLGELCAELGEALLDDGVPESAQPHFAEARALAEQALALLPPEAADPVVSAQVVHGWALVGLGEHAAAAGPLRAAVRTTTAAGDRALLATALLALGRALRRQGDGRGADEQLARALATATEHGLPRLRRAALRELCTLHAELDDAGRALPYLQAYLADELDRVDERRTRWVELFGRRKSLLETERAAGQLRRQAYEDPLTGLPNRRYAEATLDCLLSSGSAPALAVVDVDRFKQVNDTAGHPTGDAVLRTVAELLCAGVRDTDEVCRWAGDEFVVLLPDTTAEQAERALERTRRAVAEHDWAGLGVDLPVTISVGVASATRGDDRRTLFAAADGVLYDAKRSGRDRVVRLSTVTQTRAGDGPLDALFGPPGRAATAVTDGSGGEDTARAVPRDDASAAPRVPAVQPSPLDDPAGAPGGFASLLVEPVDPPLGLGTSGEPALGPVPATARPAGSGGVGTAPAAPLRDGPAEPEVVWGTGRSTEQVLALVRTARREFPDRPAVVVRASAETLVALASEHDAYTTVDAAAMSAAVGPLPEPAGRIGVLRGVGGDRSVAAEAAFAARVTGTEVVRVDDVSGGRRTGAPELPGDVDCLVVVAGTDASLAGLVGVLTDVPVVAVPTSTGQPGSFGGFGALLTVLNSASPGVVVSNIDDGHAAGVFAARIARRSRRG